MVKVVKEIEINLTDHLNNYLASLQIMILTMSEVVEKDKFIKMIKIAQN